MYIHDACEQAYKNGYEAGRNSMTNQCVVCGAEIPEGGHVCKACIAKAEATYPLDYLIKAPELPRNNVELSFGTEESANFYVCYHREKPLNKFQIWMYKVCFGIRARNI